MEKCYTLSSRLGTTHSSIVTIEIFETQHHLHSNMHIIWECLNPILIWSCYFIWKNSKCKLNILCPAWPSELLFVSHWANKLARHGTSATWMGTSVEKKFETLRVKPPRSTIYLGRFKILSFSDWSHESC